MARQEERALMRLDGAATVTTPQTNRTSRVTEDEEGRRAHDEGVAGGRRKEKCGSGARLTGVIATLDCRLPHATTR